MCDALIALESANVIHRDVKPSNVFVDKEGHIKLGDFGSARLMSRNSTHSVRIGTVDYMAPEVYTGTKNYDQTVDIYSLGMMLYLLLNDNLRPWEDFEEFDP